MWEHQECPRHQEQEDIEEEQGFDEDKVREDAGTEAAAHSLERHLPQMEGVKERQPAVPAVSGCLDERERAESIRSQASSLDPRHTKT